MADEPADKGGEPNGEPLRGAFKLRSLTQLRPHQCKWPVLEDHARVGHFLFCGRPTDGFSPYCAQHHHMAMSKPSKNEYRRTRFSSP